MPKNPAFPDCPETKAWEAFVTVIAGDPGLAAAGVEVESWDGSPDDLIEPTAAEMPMILLATRAGDTGWQSESEHKSDLAISVRCFIAGTSASDQLNVWGLFRKAMFPPAGSARRAAVDGLMGPLVVNGRLSRQAIDAKAPASGQEFLVSEGMAVLRINVNT